MTTQEYLLTKLAEECCEVAQRATKALRFGLKEVQSGQTLTNSERIVDELTDLIVIVHMLEDRGKDFKYSMGDYELEKREQKVLKYMDYSRQCGTLTD